MSDERITTTLLEGDWWYFAARIVALISENNKRRDMADLPAIQWHSAAITGGMFFEGYLETDEPPALHLTITGANGQTYVQSKAAASLADFWRAFEADITTLARTARDIRRQAFGDRFRDLLIRYYDRRAKGESPVLRQMADEAGLNYASLRQYKIKFDAERRAAMKEE